MSHPVITLPKLIILKEQLKDPKWVKYYDDADAITGSPESMDYLLKFLKKS